MIICETDKPYSVNVSIRASLSDIRACSAACGHKGGCIYGKRMISKSKDLSIILFISLKIRIILPV